MGRQPTTIRTTAGAVIGTDAGAVADAWRAAEELPLPHGISIAAVDAITCLLDDPDARDDTSPGSPLDEAASRLVEGGDRLDVVVAHLAGLRAALHARLLEYLHPEPALAAGQEVNAAVDALVQACSVRVAASLEEAAFVDPLTGLLNRSALARDLRRELALASRRQHRVAVLVGDLDGLKAMNDRLGHAAGDTALRALASALAASLRAGDSAYRVGGDEFVLVLPVMAATEVDAIVERVRAAGAPAFGWGAAAYPEDGDDPAVLLGLADRRLLSRRSAERSDRPSPGRAGLVAVERAQPSSPARTRRAGRRAWAAGLATTSLLLGGGYAAAAGGLLPAAAQRLAHAVLAEVNLGVPSGAPGRTDVGARPSDTSADTVAPGSRPGAAYNPNSGAPAPLGTLAAPTSGVVAASDPHLDLNKTLAIAAPAPAPAARAVSVDRTLAPESATPPLAGTAAPPGTARGSSEMAVEETVPASPPPLGDGVHPPGTATPPLPDPPPVSPPPGDVATPPGPDGGGPPTEAGGQPPAPPEVPPAPGDTRPPGGAPAETDSLFDVLRRLVQRR